ncbi:MAG: nitroreductase [Woeseia sp.]
MTKRATGKDNDLVAMAERIRARRTVKLFLERPVSRKLILDAIEAARWAPNHHVTEPWHFYVLGPDAIRGSIELTRTVATERKGAAVADFKAAAAAAIPGWLVVTCSRSEDALRQQEDYGSCCCAIQNLMLYLSAAGAASKWSTGPVTKDPRFDELLGIDSNKELVVGLIWYGYPKITPVQSRKDVTTIVTETL